MGIAQIRTTIVRDGLLLASAKTIPSIWWELQSFQGTVGGVVSCVSCSFPVVLLSYVIFRLNAKKIVIVFLLQISYFVDVFSQFL